MRLEALETRTNEFDERNLVLQAFLGMLSAAKRVDRILDREAPAHTTAQRGVVHEEDRLLVEFVLGVVSFRETIGRIVTDAATPSRRAATSPPPRDARVSDGDDILFRGVLR